jgi:hypothetical protein
MAGHDDDFIMGADDSSMVTGARPQRLGTSPGPSHLTPLQDYLIKTGKDHYFTYRPAEYYSNPADYDVSAVLCSITEVSGSLHFSFGADILDREIRRDPRVQLDRAVLWPSDMVEKFKVNKGIYTNRNVRDFDIILISAFMIHQALNVVPFLLQCRINPMKDSREQLVVMGGNCALLYRYLNRITASSCDSPGTWESITRTTWARGPGAPTLRSNSNSTRRSATSCSARRRRKCDEKKAPGDPRGKSPAQHPEAA